MAREARWAGRAIIGRDVQRSGQAHVSTARLSARIGARHARVHSVGLAYRPVPIDPEILT